MSKYLRVAIIGCGQFADAHVQEIKKIKNAQVVAVCDLERLMAEQLAERYDIPACYADAEKMYEESRPDVVHITTPPQSHYAIAIDALNHGCHAYIEKPLGINSKETDAIIALAKKTGRKITVGYSYYFEPVAIKMRELISRGILGSPVHVESFYGYNLSGSFGSLILGSKNHWVHHLPGKLFHNNIDHLISKVTEFIPDRHPQVIAKGYKLRGDVHGDSRDNMFDELRVMIIGEKTSGYATLSSKSCPIGHFSRIYGTKSTLHVDYNIRTIVNENGQKYPSAIGRLLPSLQMGLQYLRQGRSNIWSFMKNDFHFFYGMNKLITKFYDSITKGDPVPIAYEELSRISTINDAIFAQLSQG